jgi:hypothetical protein
MAYRLYRHRPTTRWLPIIQDPKERTPGTAYLSDLARDYNLVATDIDVIVTEDLPRDFDANRVPIPTPPAPPALTTFALETNRDWQATFHTMLDLVNIERAEHGRPAVTREDFLAAVKARTR